MIVWQDSPSAGSFTDYSTWAQRVNSIGAAQWITNGLAIITGTDNQLSEAVSDQAHGAIVPWVNQLTDGGDVYAQRI